MHRVVIIGNGISGSSCARHLRKARADLSITMVSKETPYFYSRTALMYVYMGHMRFKDIHPYAPSFWRKNRIDLRDGYACRIDRSKRHVHLDTGEVLGYDVLVLATGSVSRKGGWAGEDLDGIGTLYSYQDLNTMTRLTRRAAKGVVVGGGLIGVELAEMLHSRGIEVVFLVRESDFWAQALPPAEAHLVARHLRAHKIDLRLKTEIKAFIGDNDHRVCGVETHSGERIACDWAGVAIGVEPRITEAQKAGIRTNQGILVNEYLQSSDPHIYAIGDCAELRYPTAHRKAIEPIWYIGQQMGETLARHLTKGGTAYTPALWYNSAKFFDLEYQIYGRVPVVEDASIRSLYWESPKGNQCMRIAYAREGHAVIGCHVLGWRQRHEVWHAWITQQTPIEVVLPQLEKARFDAEFAYAPEKDIRKAFFLKTHPHTSAPS